MNTQINKIGLVAMCAAVVGVNTMVAQAPQTPDRWGQTPKPEAVQKMEEALRIGGKDPEGAEALLKAALVADPNYYRAQYNLGLLSLKQNKKMEAVEQMRKAHSIQ